MTNRELGVARVVHPYRSYWEPLELDPTFVLRPMFGTRAAYVAGKLVLCFSARAGAWHGVLVATDHCHHASLTTEFPSLEPHPILPKWLFLADSAEAFERTVERLVQLVRRRDPRIGVTPQGARRKDGPMKRNSQRAARSRGKRSKEKGK